MDIRLPRFPLLSQIFERVFQRGPENVKTSLNVTQARQEPSLARAKWIKNMKLKNFMPTVEKAVAHVNKVHGAERQNAAVPCTELFMNKAEVAGRLRKTVRTVENWMESGILPYYKVGRSVVFRWSDIEAQLRAKCGVNLPGRAKAESGS